MFQASGFHHLKADYTHGGFFRRGELTAATERNQKRLYTWQKNFRLRRKSRLRLHAIAEKARLPTFETVPEDKRLYKSHGDRTEKGRLVHTSNLS
ncbi:hypothetical protein TNCV_1510661 [Trichonephila clavipes]|nr:hypothetical protein TNCV_1510661 [Trichonephila clavipes]